MRVEHRDAKVGDLRSPVGIQQDVGGLEIAVDQAAVVGRLNAIGDLSYEASGVLCRDGAFKALERAARDVLEDDEVLAEIKRLHDVHVLDVADAACFLATLLAAQDLDSDKLLMVIITVPGVARQVDRAGAAIAEEITNRVARTLPDEFRSPFGCSLEHRTNDICCQS